MVSFFRSALRFRISVGCYNHPDLNGINNSAPLLPHPLFLPQRNICWLIKSPGSPRASVCVVSRFHIAIGFKGTSIVANLHSRGWEIEVRIMWQSATSHHGSALIRNK